MKKKIFICLTFILSLFALVSCVGQVSEHVGTGSADGDSGNTGGGTVDDSELIEYTARIYRGGSLWRPTIDIEAIFDNGISTTAVKIDLRTGEAKFKGDGEYNVHLSTLPTGYLYNPNINIVTPQHPEINIVLSPEQRYLSGTGAYSPMSSSYRLSNTGIYRVTLQSASDVRYFQMKPTNPGIYTVESIVDVYDDMINPSFKFYFGHEAYRNESSPEISEDDGLCLSGGYTRNFKYDIPWDAAQINQWQNFSISAESKTGDYPITVLFQVTYAGEYHMPYPSRYPIYPEKAISDTLEQEGTLTAVTDATGGDLDSLDYRYREADGYWHIYDEELYASTDGYGPTLVLYLNRAIPCLGYTLSYLSEQQAYYLCIVDECYDYMLYGTGPLFAGGEPLIYTGDFYSRHANSDGVVFVTNELQQFLQKLAINQRFFFDGKGYLEPGISSGEDNQWLFACGYYA